MKEALKELTQLCRDYHAYWCADGDCDCVQVTEAEARAMYQRIADEVTA